MHVWVKVWPGSIPVEKKKDNYSGGKRTETRPGILSSFLYRHFIMLYAYSVRNSRIGEDDIPSLVSVFFPSLYLHTFLCVTSVHTYMYFIIIIIKSREFFF